MKSVYTTPDAKIIKFDLEKNIMDGYEPGNVVGNPWDDMFNETSGDGDMLDVNH